LQVVVWLDEAKAIKDTVHVLVEEGPDIPVHLTAQGVGQTITCTDFGGPIDFGSQFTGVLLLRFLNTATAMFPTLSYRQWCRPST
jgi:hypothetical protein